MDPPPEHLTWAMNDAVFFGDLDVARRLVRQDRRLLEASLGPRAESALLMAIDHRHTRLAAFLMDEGANVHRLSGREPKKAPIEIAAYQADFDMIELLLDRGADARSDRMKNALGHAVLGGRLEIVDMMVRKAICGAGSSDSITRRALEYACSLGRVAMVQLLLEAGGDFTGLYWNGISTSCKPIFEDRLRAFFIFRARSLRDSSMSLPYHIYKKAVGPARAALQEAAPSYLRKRVAKKKPLPIVHMRKDDKVQISQGVEQELVPEQKLGKEVLRHVVVVMPKELVKEWWEFLGGL